MGSKTPGLTLTDGDLGKVTNETFADKKVVYNIFPSVDTGVCAASVRHFDEDTAGLDNTIVVNASRNLPFTLGRLCTVEGLDNVEVASDFHHGFGKTFGVVQQDGPLACLLARAIAIADEEGKVIYDRLADEITTESDYDPVLAALK